MPASFTCDLSGTTTKLKHAWGHTIGGSRALLALRAGSSSWNRATGSWAFVM